MGDVSLRVRDRQPEAGNTPASPRAARQRRSRWRDPRLWLGAALVLASVVIGGRVLAAADDTVAVWQVGHDVPAGNPLQTSDLRVTRIHFEDPAVAEQYVEAAGPIKPGALAARDLHVGEILAVSAVRSTQVRTVRQLPLGVGAAAEPADLRAGDHVEVWAVPGSAPGTGGRSPSVPRLVLREATVLSAGTSAVGAAGERQVVVALGPAVDVGSVLRQLVGASVVLVRLAR